MESKYNTVEIMPDNDVKISPINEKLSPADINALNVHAIILKRQNPHPILVLCLIMTIVLFLYIIYVVFILKSKSGKWYDDRNKIMYSIHHNPITDTIHLNSRHGNFRGKYKNNVIYLNNGAIGILALNKIRWI